MKALIVAALVAASPAVSQECIATVDAYASLTQKHGEERLYIALLPDGRIIEFWANRSADTWSMFVTHPNGLSCSVGSGTGFETFQAKPNA